MKYPNSPSTTTTTNSENSRLAGLPRFSTLPRQWNHGFIAGLSLQYEARLFGRMPTTQCEGSSSSSSSLPQETPCSTCRYTGMAVCSGLSLYCLKLAKELKQNKPFYYGGAVVWASAGIYRSMLD